MATCGFSENANNFESTTTYLTPEALDRLQRVGAKIFRNDEDGDVIATIKGWKKRTAEWRSPTRVANIADAVEERARGIRLDRRRIRLEEPGSAAISSTLAVVTCAFVDNVSISRQRREGLSLRR